MKEILITICIFITLLCIYCGLLFGIDLGTSIAEQTKENRENYASYNERY